ncbi:MAG: hypothetical protein CM1200mP16_04810 [Nitrospina sp.]|nr:MAG: hypothetical protein CM1200mP16_04810 [Nitrospina sp.]
MIKKSIDGERFTEIKTIQGNNVMVVVVPLTETINNKISFGVIF